MTQDTTPHDSAAGPNDDNPSDPSRRRLLQGLAAIGAAGAAGATTALAGCATDAGAGAPTAVAPGGTFDAQLKANIKTVVVIYLENRSFNNLFGDFPGVEKPLSKVPASAYTQLDRGGKTPMSLLPPVFDGLVPRPQMLGGKKYHIGEKDIPRQPNAPYMLKDAEGKLLPESVITRDLWHLFWQNQMQINGGANNQFAAWADSGGLVMGYYGETAKTLDLYKIAQQYTMCDNFFMAAFGGSFLNHQFLVSARPPVYPNAASSPARDKIAVLADGPQGVRLAVSAESPASAADGKPKFVRDGAITPDGFAVNTMMPAYQPSPVKPAASGDKRFADPLAALVRPHDHVGNTCKHRAVPRGARKPYLPAIDPGNRANGILESAAVDVVGPVTSPIAAPDEIRRRPEIEQGKVVDDLEVHRVSPCPGTGW